MTNKPKRRMVDLQIPHLYNRTRTFTSAGVLIGDSRVDGARPASLQLLTTSSGHPFSRILQSKKKYKGKHPKVYKVTGDIGGNFLTSRITPNPMSFSYQDRQNVGGGYVVYNGCICANSQAAQVPVAGSILPPSTSNQLDAMGTIGIAKCLPTNPLANTGQFLGELHDLPRFFDPIKWIERARSFKNDRSFSNAFRSGRFVAKNGSSEYLNYQFGWVPFLTDVYQFFQVASNAQQHIKQLERDSGRNIRRGKRILSTSSTSSPTVLTGQQPYPLSGSWGTTGTLTTSITSTQDVWFKGCFTYYLPPVDGIHSSKFERFGTYANYLFGISFMTPDLLWQLTPWSWALGWLTSVNSVVHNWSAFSSNGLVMRYGYVMETKTEMTEYTFSSIPGKSIVFPVLRSSVMKVTKSRRAATPYGFGLNPASFSPFQQSIIAALGINLIAGWK